MKKFIVIMSTIFFLVGCQTVGELQQASSKGVANAFSCQQIKNAFAAYQGDRDSLEALKTVAAMTNMSTKGVTANTADSYYEKARNSANLALVLQGCQPL
jgi:2-keto-3-deoxy-6-phosphogluconate aldolase